MVQTESTSKSETTSEKQAIKYLMGLETADEEEGTTAEIAEEVEKKQEEEISYTSESMKQAQKYLRVHRIFEFFQFIIAHMLSALPGKFVDWLLQ